MATRLMHRSWSLDSAVDALAEDYSYGREAYPEIPEGLGDMLEELARALRDMNNSLLDGTASSDNDANLHGAHADSVREDLVKAGIGRFLSEQRSAA